MNAVVLKVDEGHALRLGDVHMVVKEDGMHTRGALGLAEFEVAPQGQQVEIDQAHGLWPGRISRARASVCSTPCNEEHWSTCIQMHT